MLIGYARVSGPSQDLGLQLAELKAAGCNRTYADVISGAKLERPRLNKLMRELQRDDIVIVTRLDRLARSTRDLLNILDNISKAGAGFKSLKDLWADTTTPHGRLMLTILGGLAEFERELIRARTSEGRKRAKEKGVIFGRPRKLSGEPRVIALAKAKEGYSLQSIADVYGVHRTTIGRILRNNSPSPLDI